MDTYSYIIFSMLQLLSFLENAVVIPKYSFIERPVSTKVSHTAGINVWNPAFDVTPAALITGGIVTEFGVFSPADLRDKLTARLEAKAFTIQ